jgi:hypothetical protein
MIAKSFRSTSAGYSDAGGQFKVIDAAMVGR